MEKIRYEVGSVALKVLIESIGFFAKTFSFLSSLASDPLFSTVVVLYFLILLYLPRIFVDLVFSPVLISTAVLLSTLLRLGSIQNVEKQKEIDSSPVEDHKWIECEFETDTEKDTVTEACFNSSSKPFISASNPFVEWNVRAPLEVIFEAYEGEEEEDSNNKEESRQMGMDRMLSLSLYYPESDSESSSDGDFPAIERWDSQESMCFRWNEEDREGLIEILLDGKSSSASVFQVQEENLIEIDLSHTPFGSQATATATNTDFPGECQNSDSVNRV